MERQRLPLAAEMRLFKAEAASSRDRSLGAMFAPSLLVVISYVIALEGEA